MVVVAVLVEEEEGGRAVFNELSSFVCEAVVPLKRKSEPSPTAGTYTKNNARVHSTVQNG